MYVRSKFGYYRQCSKSWLIIISNSKQHAKTLFTSTEIQITTDGQRHLGAVIGSEKLKQKYINEKVNQRVQEL